jgi:hypothetical protein
MVVAMVEINDSTGDRTLHRHATHCFFVRDGLVAESWMVEALPAGLETGLRRRQRRRGARQSRLPARLLPRRTRL